MDLNGLPAELEQFVQQEIAGGKYQSTEEVVSAALRHSTPYRTYQAKTAWRRRFPLESDRG